MTFRNFKCNFLPCSANNYSQLIDPVHLDWALHWKSHLFRKTYIHSDKVHFTNFSFLYALFFKTENSWSNKAKTVCQQQKPQRRPCSELLKYLTTNDDPPHTKPTENRTSSRDKCASKKKSHTQPQSQHAQGRPVREQRAAGRGAEHTLEVWAQGSRSSSPLCLSEARGGRRCEGLPWTQIDLIRFSWWVAWEMSSKDTWIVSWAERARRDYNTFEVYTHLDYWDHWLLCAIFGQLFLGFFDFFSLYSCGKNKTREISSIYLGKQ